MSTPYWQTQLMWTYPRRGQAEARFEVDGMPVVVSFAAHQSGPRQVALEVETGYGGQLAHASFRVFFGIVQALEEFALACQLEAVILATKRRDLADLYAVQLRQERRTLEQIGFEVQEPVRMDPYTEFRLQRASVQRKAS